MVWDRSLLARPLRTDRAPYNGPCGLKCPVRSTSCLHSRRALRPIGSTVVADFVRGIGACALASLTAHSSAMAGNQGRILSGPSQSVYLLELIPYPITGGLTSSRHPCMRTRPICHRPLFGPLFVIPCWACSWRHGRASASRRCYLADTDDRLSRNTDPVPDLTTRLWLLTHPDLRRVARIRTFLDEVGDAARSALGDSGVDQPGLST